MRNGGLADAAGFAGAPQAANKNVTISATEIILNFFI
jgi:hypothetical protein